MLSIFRLARTVPVIIAVCGTLVGCQGDGVKNKTSLALASATLSDAAGNSNSVSGWKERNREWRASYQDTREEYLEKRRGKLLERKQKSGGKTSKQNTPQVRYGNLIAKYAKQHGVPLHLARAVVQVESNFRSNATGAAGEVGLMQIKLSTARQMGYNGSKKALYNPETNLNWGMKYLGKAHRLSGGTTCGTILKYNAGHGAKKMNRISARYCGKVKRILS